MGVLERLGNYHSCCLEGDAATTLPATNKRVATVNPFHFNSLGLAEAIGLSLTISSKKVVRRDYCARKKMRGYDCFTGPGYDVNKLVKRGVGDYYSKQKAQVIYRAIRKAGVN
jgi:hypothetical protein